MSFILEDKPLEKLNSQKLSFNPVLGSTDRDGNIYLVDSDDDIHKLDKNGKYILSYSPQKMAETTIFEAWNSISLIIFYKDFQEYTLLDRFLTFKSSGSIDATYIGFARVVTLSSDNNLWIIDDTDFSLKKYDLTYKKLKVSTSLDLILDPQDYDIIFAREYHNNLYVLDRKNGILVFDNLGNYKKTIGLKGIEHIGFYNDKLYYADNGKVVIYDLYEKEITERLVRGMTKFDPVIINSGKLYHATKRNLDVYKYDKLFSRRSHCRSSLLGLSLNLSCFCFSYFNFFHMNRFRLS